MKQQLARFVIRHRIFFLSLPLLISLVALLPLRRLQIATSLGDFVPLRHPVMEVQKKLEAVFGGLNQVSIVIAAKEGTIFQPAILKKVYQLTEDLYFTEGVNISRINGLAAHKMRRIQADETGFKIERLMPQVPETPAEVIRLQETVKRNPMVYGVFVSKDLTSTLIQADFFSGIASGKIFEKVRSLAASISGPEIEVYYSGRPILEGWLDFYLPKMGHLFILSLVILAGLLYLSFHSKRGVIIPLLSGLMASLWGLSCLAIAGYSLSPSTILVPFLVLALGVSHSVQFLKRYYEEAKKSSHRYQTGEKVLSSLWIPGSISLLTDGAGFLTLLFIPFRLLQTMALAATVGVFSLFLTTIFFIPALLSFLPLPPVKEIEKEQRPGFLDSLMVHISSWITERKKVIFLIFSVSALFGVRGLLRLHVGDEQPGSPALYPDTHYNISEAFINRNFGGTDPYYIMVEGNIPEALLSTEVLREMESLQSYLLQQVPEAGRGSSLVDYVKGFNMVFNEGKFEHYRIPEKDATIGEYLFLYSISGFPGDFDHVCSPDFRHASIKIDLKDHRSSTIKKLLLATKNWIATNHRTKTVNFLFPGGIIGQLAAVNDVIRKSIPQSLMLVTPVILVTSSLFLGSFQQGLLLLLPLLYSILVTFGVMGFMGAGLTVETLPLASLGIGLGVDYGIYILGRMKDEGRNKEAIRRSLLSSGKAVFFTAASVSAGVLVWIFSPVKMEAKLGITLACLLILNMVAALFLLPALFSSEVSKEEKYNS